jgi:hypothetical protein
MALTPSGPPATPRQVQYLKALLERTYGLTQKQSSGKFTRQEASALIDRLANGEPAEPPEPEPDTGVAESQALVLRGMPASLLADELIRRGWTVTEPD